MMGRYGSNENHTSAAKECLEFRAAQLKSFSSPWAGKAVSQFRGRPGQVVKSASPSSLSGETCRRFVSV
jgi:hypothetical protein